MHGWKGDANQSAFAGVKSEFDNVYRTNFAEVKARPGRRWTGRRVLRYIRDIRDHSFYLKQGHPSPALAHRIGENLPILARFAVRNPCIRWAFLPLLTSRPVQKALEYIERTVLPPEHIVDWLNEVRPDVMVASPFIMDRSKELDWVKAAISLNIPTVASVASWDNLTTKGIFHILPDLVFVWNMALVEEANQLHDIPLHRLCITGSPTFDFWFGMSATMDRESFCQQIGIDPTNPFITYLSSSTTIAGDETPAVREFTEALAEHPETKNVIVVVRPHPLNADIWDDFSQENVVVWPRGGEIPEWGDTQQNYYHSIVHAAAVVGVNTSAFLDAAVLGKPCLTILTERYREVQEQLGHFYHLLNGDFLDVVRENDQAAEAIAGFMKGIDPKEGDRRRFVQDFLRPMGIDKPATPVMADAILAAAEGRNMNPANSVLASSRPSEMVTT